MTEQVADTRSLEQETGDAYQVARNRDWAPISYLDTVYGQTQRRLAEIRQIVSNGLAPGDFRRVDNPAEERAKALRAALAIFQHWATMPTGQIATELNKLRGNTLAAPVTTPADIARHNLAEFRRRGISITTDAHGRLTVLPRSKLMPKDIATLTDTRKEIAAELSRDVMFF